jgi:hypothetical protein
MVIFSLAFAALLVVSISLFDYHTPVDRRILSPVYAAFLIVAGCLLAQANRRDRAVRGVAWTIALILSLWSIGRGARLAHEQFRDGAGFAHRQWRESETLALLKQRVPQDTLVYTNAPGAMYLPYRPGVDYRPAVEVQRVEHAREPEVRRATAADARRRRCGPRGCRLPAAVRARAAAL